MGNTLGRKKTTKVMKIDGQTIKFRCPVYASEVLKDYPNNNMVLLESEAVKHFGVRAKPLEPQEELKHKRLYFLVELPKIPEEKKTPRMRFGSGIQMSAKDRLETLMLGRRAVSDLSSIKPVSMGEEFSSASGPLLSNGPVRLKLRLQKAEVEKLMMQSNDEDENDVVEKIMQLYKVNNGGSGPLFEEQSHSSRMNNNDKGPKSRQKRVGFLPITEGEIQVAVSS